MIPRGVRFRVELLDGAARGYVCENFGAALPPARPRPDRLQRPRQSARLPHAGRLVRGPRRRASSWSAKFMGNLWAAEIDHSPLDVVAWHGNYAPYKYDLRRFNAIGSISYDHPDPSIFLVLQSLSDTPGVDDDRLRDLPAAHAGDAAHLPPALVPPQRRERVHGPDPRRVRREGGGLLARRREPAQLHERPRPGRRDLREGEQRRPVEARTTSATPWRSCSRRAASIRPTQFALESAQLQADYFRVLAGTEEELRSEPAVELGSSTKNHLPRPLIGWTSQERSRTRGGATRAARRGGESAR